ncbi:DDE-type integrase/transposase/recombinase [Methylocystis sp. WRRC1]|uniref:DDE-type integrase/transposase/recombinase n=1 Tax=unclassified Methylocystis TaxID=2625913 RepID=UPI0001F86840|nr:MULTISPECIES: DDE-type integrase/transposase/recombinase [unclassified Methylocystis]MCC3246182.1 DDE-type integrase/transposase/recombinase [Methylocystis sp. WRRC1]
MRDWLSASDLAGLGLPGLPATKRGWTDYAEREGWLERRDANGRPLVRVVKGVGGGRLQYHIDLLPPATLAAYVAKHVGRVDLPVADAEEAALDDAQTITAQEARDARLSIIAAADRLARDGGLSRVNADRMFAGLYNMGRIEVEGWVRAAVRKLSPRTLARWRALKSTEGISRLGVDKGAARRGKGRLESGEEGKVRAFLLAAIAQQPHLSSDHLRLLTIAQFPSLADVSPRSFQRMRAKIEREEKVLLTRVTNPDAYKSKYRLSGTNSHPVSRLNELWMIDASPVDALCVDGRHSVYLCVDIFSRRLIVYVSKTPRAQAVQLLMRRAIVAWGVPERVKTDNGSDFKAKSTQRLFAALGIEVEASASFSPEEKGHIERAVKTFQHDLTPLLPGFIGHNVKDRKVIEERRAFAQRLGIDDAGAFKAELTAKELQSICDDWAAGRYANRPHAGINGATPFQAAAAFAGVVRRIDDIRALDLLLAPIAAGDGTRIVTKRGVRIDGSYYLAPNVLPETRVFVRMDPEDMGRAWLFSDDGAEFLGEAICPELAGVDPAAAVAEARVQQKRLLDENAARLRADMKKIKPRDMVDVIVRNAARDAGKLVEFPKPVESYTTPGLEAAKAAVSDASTPVEAPAKPAATAIETHVHRLPETRQQRYRRARELEARLANNERIDMEEMRWLVGYQTGAEYLAMKEMFEEFGEAALK